MGILSTIGKAVTKVVSKVLPKATPVASKVSNAADAIDPVNKALVKPIEKATNTAVTKAISVNQPLAQASANVKIASAVNTALEISKQTAYKASQVYSTAFNAAPKTTIAATIASPIIIKSAINEPEKVSQAVKAGTDLYGAAWKAAGKESTILNEAVSYAKDHPIASTLIAAGGAFVVGKSIGTAGLLAINALRKEQQDIQNQYKQQLLTDKTDPKTKNEKVLETDNIPPDTQTQNNNNVSDTPLTSATADVKQISSGIKKKTRRKVKPELRNVNVKVNIANQSRLISNKNYIKKLAY